MSIKRMSNSSRKKAIARIIERDGAMCCECSTPRKMSYRKGGATAHNEYRQPIEFYIYQVSNLHLEHVVPLHLGGSNDDNNLRLMCAACHQKKTSKEQSERLKALGAGRNL